MYVKVLLYCVGALAHVHYQFGQEEDVAIVTVPSSFGTIRMEMSIEFVCMCANQEVVYGKESMFIGRRK